MNKEPLDKFSELVVVYLFGPSGSGKSYLAKKLVEDYPKEFHRPLQVTTRAMRNNEKDGVDYEFIDYNKYENLLISGQLCCTTDITTEKRTNYYGTPKKNLSQDKINIIVVDRVGYANRPFTESELLIGLDYTFNENTDQERIAGREKRDQRDTFEKMKDIYFVDALYLNSSVRYMKTSELRRGIYTKFMGKEIFEPCFKFQ